MERISGDQICLNSCSAGVGLTEYQGYVQSSNRSLTVIDCTLQQQMAEGEEIEPTCWRELVITRLSLEELQYEQEKDWEDEFGRKLKIPQSYPLTPPPVKATRAMPDDRLARRVEELREKLSAQKRDLADLQDVKSILDHERHHELSALRADVEAANRGNQNGSPQAEFPPREETRGMRELRRALAAQIVWHVAFGGTVASLESHWPEWLTRETLEQTGRSPRPGSPAVTWQELLLGHEVEALLRAAEGWRDQLQDLAQTIGELDQQIDEDHAALLAAETELDRRSGESNLQLQANDGPMASSEIYFPQEPPPPPWMWAVAAAAAVAALAVAQQRIRDNWSDVARSLHWRWRKPLILKAVLN
jgi:hypothetical protein